MSLTTISTTPIVLENRGSGNKRMKDWPSKVLRIHMTNSVDGWDHLCVLILSRTSLTTISEVDQKALRESSDDSNG
jgi:hypothetical protein